MYDVDYFIDKFEKIPDDKWCIGSFDGPYGSHCALGHCGCHDSNRNTDEANALRNLFEDSDLIVSAVDVNDDHLYSTRPFLDASTPKQRILNALQYIKKNISGTDQTTNS